MHENAPTRRGAGNYLEFVDPESYVIRDEGFGPQISLRMGTSTTPPIYAYKDGEWGWELFLRYMGAMAGSDQHAMALLAKYDRANRKINLTPAFMNAENAEVVMDMIKAGSEGKTSLPKYLAIIDGIRESDRAKPKPPTPPAQPKPRPASTSSSSPATTAGAPQEVCPVLNWQGAD